MTWEVVGCSSAISRHLISDIDDHALYSCLMKNSRKRMVSIISMQ